MLRSMFLFWCAFLWCTNCYASDISYLDRGSILEKDIAAIFNKVAYGGVTTTKRSISSKYPPVSGGTPTTIPPPLTSILIPTTTPVTSNTPKTSQEQKTDNANKTEKKDLTIRNQNTQAYTTNLPPYLAPKTSFPIAYTTPSSRGEVPSYIPPVRSFFTPPLPPEYANPFADKPTLRGSNSDGTLATGGRRPVPPPRQELEVYGRERIPLRPPDLGPDINIGSPSQDRKKPLNTPSFNRSPDAPSYDTAEHEAPSSAKPQNDTDFDFVPILHYPSVSRILSGSNGRKDFPDVHSRPHVESPRLPKMPEHYPKIDLESLKPVVAGGSPAARPPAPADSFPRVVAAVPPEDDRGRGGGEAPVVRDPAKSVDYDSRPSKDEKSIGIPDSIDIESKLDSEAENRGAERLPSPEPQPPKISDADSTINLSNKNLEYKPSRKNTNSSWLLAWDIHVYLIATLFLILAISSLINLLRINSYKRLLSHGYYISVHSFLLIIGTLRSFYLFLDAYNVKGMLPRPFSDLVLNVVSPLITSTFIILFLFVLKASKVDVLSSKFQRPFGVAIFIVFHVFLVIAFELTSEIQPELQILPLVSQCIYIIILVILGITYLYVYKVLAGGVVRKSENIFGGNFTNVYKPTIAVTIRTMLAVALLALLMAAIQLYGVFGVLESWKHDPGNGNRNLQWVWWGYQFSVRLVEVAACFLMLWAGIQSLRCHGGGANGGADDEKNSDNSGFALFRCGQCATSSAQGDPSDDIYPAVCVTNQAIHDYTLRTGKKVYDDSFPLNALHSQMHGGGVGATLGAGVLQRDGSSPNSVHYEDPGNLVGGAATSDRRSLRRTYQTPQDAYSAGSRAMATNNYASYDEHGVLATEGGYQQGRFNYEDSNFSTNERRSSKKVSPNAGGFDFDDFTNPPIGEGRGGSGGKSGSYLDVNARAHRAAEKRAAAMKKSGTFDGADDSCAGSRLGPTKSATTERRSAKARGGGGGVGDPRGSLKKGEWRAPMPHRGAQTLNGAGAAGRPLPADARSSPNASMLVAENGFVRFRALQEPEEVDSDECLMER